MGPNDHEDLANKLLDSALQHYGEAEPRAGLESRVLASLTVEQERIASSAFNWWLVPAGVGVLAIVSLALVIDRRSDARRVQGVSPTTVANSRLLTNSPSPYEPTASTFSTHAKSVRTVRISVRHSATSSAKEGRLAHFPSPQPLSKQEELLVLYVSRFHQQAAQTAREQTELFKNEEAERAGTSISYLNNEEKFRENE